MNKKYQVCSNVRMKKEKKANNIKSRQCHVLLGQCINVAVQ